MDYASHQPPSSQQQSALTTVPITAQQTHHSHQSQVPTKPEPVNRTLASAYSETSSTSEEFLELKPRKPSSNVAPQRSAFQNSPIDCKNWHSDPTYSQQQLQNRTYEPAQTSFQRPDSSFKTETGSLYESLAAAAALASHASQPLSTSSYFYPSDQVQPGYYPPSNYPNSIIPSTTSSTIPYPTGNRVNLETPNTFGWPHLSVGTSQSTASAFAHLTAAQQMIISSQYSHLSPHSYFGNNDVPSQSFSHYPNQSVFHHFGKDLTVF